MNNICSKFILSLLTNNSGKLFLKRFRYSPNVSHCINTRLASLTCGIHSSSTFRSEVNLKANESEKEDPEHEELDSKVLKYADLATDAEQKKKILMILMEHEVAKLEGKKVPSYLRFEDMKELLAMYTFSSRVKYLSFLFEKELKKASGKRRKELKAEEFKRWKEEQEYVKPSDHIEYGIGRNTMLLRVRKCSSMRQGNVRMANSVLFGQKLFIDLDYDCYMRKQDCQNLGEQLLELYSANRMNCFPFDLTMCNVEQDGMTMASFKRYMPNVYSPENFITLTEASYLNLFPKDQLIYITPHAREPLKQFDHNAVYILAGVVDKCIREPVVLSKAKREGIRAVHLPFDEYLMWGRGNKSLPLNQMLEILLEMKNTNDWSKAFRHVPQRKLVRSLDLYTEYL